MSEISRINLAIKCSEGYIRINSKKGSDDTGTKDRIETIKKNLQKIQAPHRKFRYIFRQFIRNLSSRKGFWRRPINKIIIRGGWSKKKWNLAPKTKIRTPKRAWKTTRIIIRII